MVSTVVARLLDGVLEAQPLIALIVGAVVIDLLASRAGAELPNDHPLALRLRRALPWALGGAGTVAVVLGAAVVLGHGRLVGASFDPVSVGLGLARAVGTVARRQIPYALVPLALLGPRVDARALVLFSGAAAAAGTLSSTDSRLSTFVVFAAAVFGAVALHATRDFVVSLAAEASVFFAGTTLFSSVIDLRLGAWSLSPLDRTQGPYAAALATCLLGISIVVQRRNRSVF